MPAMTDPQVPDQQLFCDRQIFICRLTRSFRSRQGGGFGRRYSLRTYLALQQALPRSACTTVHQLHPSWQSMGRGRSDKRRASWPHWPVLETVLFWDMAWSSVGGTDYASERQRKDERGRTGWRRRSGNCTLRPMVGKAQGLGTAVYKEEKG